MFDRTTVSIVSTRDCSVADTSMSRTDRDKSSATNQSEITARIYFYAHLSYFSLSPYSNEINCQSMSCSTSTTIVSGINTSIVIDTFNPCECLRVIRHGRMFHARDNVDDVLRGHLKRRTLFEWLRTNERLFPVDVHRLARQKHNPAKRRRPTVRMKQVKPFIPVETPCWVEKEHFFLRDKQEIINDTLNTRFCRISVNAKNETDEDLFSISMIQLTRHWMQVAEKIKHLTKD